MEMWGFEPQSWTVEGITSWTLILYQAGSLLSSAALTEGEKLIVNLGGCQFDCLLENLETDTDEFLTECFVVGKFSDCLVNNRGSEREKE
jgi:hypothetical protein